MPFACPNSKTNTAQAELQAGVRFRKMQTPHHESYDNVGDYFSNGVTATNSLSIMTGKEKMQTYFSYANTTAKGIVDVNKLQKHNITFRETASLFNDRLTLDANVNLMTQKIQNRPTSGGYYHEPAGRFVHLSRAVKTSVSIAITLKVSKTDRNE